MTCEETPIARSVRLAAEGAHRTGLMSDEKLAEFGITAEPGKLGGKLCIRGYRLSVQQIQEYLAARETVENILADFPFLSEDDLRAVADYAFLAATNYYGQRGSCHDGSDYLTRAQRLDELLAQCEPAAPISDEDREWARDAPVGKEII